jgi:hypothetical protein
MFINLSLSKAYRTAPKSNKLPIQYIRGASSQVKYGRGVKLMYLQPQLRIRMCGAIPPLLIGLCLHDEVLN